MTKEEETQVEATINALVFKLNAIGQRYNDLATICVKEGHEDYLLKKPQDEAIKPESNIYPKEAWEKVCRKLGMKFENNIEKDNLNL